MEDSLGRGLFSKEHRGGQAGKTGQTSRSKRELSLSLSGKMAQREGANKLPPHTSFPKVHLAWKIQPLISSPAPPCTQPPPQHDAGSRQLGWHYHSDQLGLQALIREGGGKGGATSVNGGGGAFISPWRAVRMPRLRGCAAGVLRSECFVPHPCTLQKRTLRAVILKAPQLPPPPAPGHRQLFLTLQMPPQKRSKGGRTCLLEAGWIQLSLVNDLYGHLERRSKQTPQARQQSGGAPASAHQPSPAQPTTGTPSCAFRLPRPITALPCPRPHTLRSRASPDDSERACKPPPPPRQQRVFWAAGHLLRMAHGHMKGPPLGKVHSGHEADRPHWPAGLSRAALPEPLRASSG